MAETLEHAVLIESFKRQSGYLERLRIGAFRGLASRSQAPPGANHNAASRS